MTLALGVAVYPQDSCILRVGSFFETGNSPGRHLQISPALFGTPVILIAQTRSLCQSRTPSAHRTKNCQRQRRQRRRRYQTETTENSQKAKGRGVGGLCSLNHGLNPGLRSHHLRGPRGCCFFFFFFCLTCWPLAAFCPAMQPCPAMLHGYLLVASS